MKRNHIPSFVQARLNRFEQTVAHLTERVARTHEAIVQARQRLTGGFQTDEEYYDLRKTLDQLVADLPILEGKLGVAEGRLSHCKQWLDALSDDLILEEVKVQTNGANVAALSQKIENAEDELGILRAAPVLSTDIKQRVQAYIAALGRPSVSGIDDGMKLEVNWPTNNAISLLAILQPEKMCDVIMAAIDRVANTPLAADKRPARMAEVRRQIVQMQRQEYALDPNANVSIEVLLGVRAVRREKHVDRRERVA